MTRCFLAIAVVVCLAACSGQKAPDDTAAQSSSAAVSQSAATAVVSTAFVYMPFPDGVSLVAPYHVRSDRIYTTKKGVKRRRVSLELLTGGVAATAEDIAKQMAASGFRTLTVKDKGDGITRLAFVKKGMGRINVSTSSNVGDKPSNPHAVGVIMFDWQLTPAPATAAPAAAIPEQGVPVDQAATGG